MKYLLFCMIFSAGLVRAVSQDGDAAGWHRFTGDAYLLRYPSSWALDSSGLMGTECFLFTPLSSATDSFSDNINLLIQPLGGADLDTYRRLTENQIHTLAPEGEIYESAILKTKDGESRYRVTYAMTMNTRRLKITSICYIADDKAYLITYTAALDAYESHLPEAEAVLRSFRLRK